MRLTHCTEVAEMSLRVASGSNGRVLVRVASDFHLLDYDQLSRVGQPCTFNQVEHWCQLSFCQRHLTGAYWLRWEFYCRRTVSDGVRPLITGKEDPFFPESHPDLLAFQRKATGLIVAWTA